MLFLFQNGRFRVGDRKHAYLFWPKCPQYEFNPKDLPDGDFIINIVYYTNDCHVIALRKNNGGIEVFNPNEGLFVSEYVYDLKVYLQEKKRYMSVYLYLSLPVMRLYSIKLVISTYPGA